jgi:opacity protein-like surface antigen
MRLLAAAGLAGLCLATSPLYAADLFDSAPPPMDAPPAQSELGSNWYIRGDVGYGQMDQATVKPEAGLFPTIGNAPIGDAGTTLSPARGNDKTTNTPVFGLGFGYHVNDYFRVEADWQFENGPGLSTQKTVYCPEVANAVSNYYTKNVATPVGYQYDYTQCDGKLNVRQYNNTALAMGYFDLGHWGLFTPYIGAGVGLNANSINGTLAFNQQDTGVTYTGPVVTGSAPGVWVTPIGTKNGQPYYTGVGGGGSGVPQPIGPANWNRTISSTKYTFAGALAAGVGMQISESATLDLGYKFETLDITGGTHSMLQSVNLGVRYNLN